jgi:PAS domain S-box-containing protein
MNDTDRQAEPGGAEPHVPAEGSAQGVFRLDAAGNFAYADARAADILGYAPEEMQGRHFAEFIFEEGLPQARARFDQRRQGIGGATEYRLRRKDGTPVWATVASVPTFDAGGIFLGVTGFLSDIDERRRQQEFSVHERRLLRQIAGNYPLSAVLEDLCVTLEAVSRRPLHATVMLAEGAILKCVAAPSLPPGFREDRAVTRLEGSGTACAEAVRSGHKVVIDDTTRADVALEIAALHRNYGFGAVWSYPIVQDGDTLGTLALLPLAPGAPDAEDERAIEFALQVARLALAHERQADALRESEQRFHDYADMAADWFWEQDADFRYTHMSGGVFNKGGFRVADSLGKTRWELPIEGVDAAQWAAHRALLERRESFHDFTYLIRAADGTQHGYSISGKPVFAAGGELLGYRGIGRDISGQKRAEEVMRTSEQRFRDFADMAADWFWEQDADLRFSRLSGGVYNTEEQGIRVADILGKRRWELPIEGVDATRWVAHRALLARREVFRDFVYCLRAADGSRRWYSVSGKPVFAADGEFLGYRGSTHDITERRRAEEALQASEQRFRDYADMAADWFWEQDADFRFTTVTYRPGGQPLTPPHYDRDSAGKHRWELPYVNVPEGFWEEHRRQLQAGRPFSNLRLQRRDDGVVRHVELSGRPLFDLQGRLIGYRGTGRDITVQVTAREKLEKTLSWLEQAVRAAGMGLWERDIETWNFSFRDNWRALFGYAADEIEDTAEDFNRLVHPEDLSRIQAAGRAYAANPQSEYEIRFRVRHKDGSWRWVLSRGNVLTDATTGRGTFIGCHLDITEQMRAEEQLRELAATLETRVEARTAALDELNRELDAFNFSVSHDLRTPLRAIEGFSRALLEDYRERLDEAGRDYLRRIGAAAMRMGELIEALHELSRLSRAPLRLRPVDLSALARELVAELREQAPERAVDIDIADTPAAEGDARLLRIVLANLLGNAWKFTGKTAPARIAFGAHRDADGRDVYFLRDNGAGFDMQFADKLFRVFHRLHREDEFPGQGVGLTTVQRIVARHGGRVWGEGERGRGATFFFTFWEDNARLAEAREAIRLA